MMKLPDKIIVMLLVFVMMQGCSDSHDSPSQTYHSELEYLKVINGAGPARDPRIIFLFMSQFMNANQNEEGIKFFSSFLEKHETQLPPVQKALYLSALGLLRASHANRVALLKRIGWVDETIAMLETAKQLSGNQIFVVRWIAGIVYARLPGRFDITEAALEELQWCLENLSKAPNFGWMREVYFHIGLAHHKLDDEEQAAKFLKMSGYDNFEKEITLIIPFSVNSETGFTFSPMHLKEIIPNQIFALSGFEFTDYYFIISENRKELIAIDAGTTPATAQKAYEFLKNRFPNLPDLTTVFVTHSHWDHIGGHRFFRELNPNIKFYARENYGKELARSLNVPVQFITSSAVISAWNL